jgi:apolipoprotein N-acyltransferase
MKIAAIVKESRSRLRGQTYLLSAVLYCFAFPTFDAFPFSLFPLVAWFCLVPALTAFQELPLRRVLSRSMLLGLLMSLFTYGWMHAFGRESASGSIAILLTLVPALAVFFGTRFFAAEYLSRRIPAMRFLHLPVIWIMIDYIQSVGLLAFPWTYLAYSQFTFLPAAQISAWGGIFSVTFIIALVNSVIAGLCVQYRRGEHSCTKDFCAVRAFPGLCWMCSGIDSGRQYQAFSRSNSSRRRGKEEYCHVFNPVFRPGKNGARTSSDILPIWNA